MEPGTVTPRERDVLELLGDQLTHEEIGRRLFVSPRTVETHVASLRRKLLLPDHRALVRFAVEQRAAPRAGADALPPVPLTSFVGRRAELAALSAALGEFRLVSAVGPGGVGKTRLAVAAAGRAGATFPDGVRWVDLVPVSDPGQLEDVVARAWGARMDSRRGPLEALLRALSGRRALLVLDNCEQHVNAVAVLVEKLVAGCPDLTVLVTSRVRLALPFERVVRVGGLSTGPDGDAVALFLERAVAAGSDPTTDAERTRISAVCAALGGLALAVELAAGRMPSLGLDGVERGLLDQESLLTGGGRTRSRHRSMHETLDWSVALLDRRSATALSRLCVLVAPFDADAAEAVAAFPPLTGADVRSALRQLADHNLLVPGLDGGRLICRMLEPVRQYGLRRMAAGDRPAFERHLSWCLRLVGDVRPEDSAAAVPRIGDDIRAALGWALDQPFRAPTAGALARGFGAVLFSAGNLREAQLRLEQAAALTPDGAVAGADLGRAAAVAKCRVLGEEALRLELAAADRARGADPPGAALALARAAELLHRFPGMFAHPPGQRADVLLAEARRLAPGDPLVAAAVAVAAAGTSSWRAAASAEVDDALRAARAVHDVVLESAALDAAGGRAVYSGDLATAHRLAGERVARLLPWHHEPLVGLELKDALHVATFCALGAGRLAEAREMARHQHDLPFLRESRDLADEELLAPAALSGDWATVDTVAERFLADWTSAGRPVAPGRALAPSAVALAAGLRGDLAAMALWLGVLADLRAVPRHEAWHGSGYGELFEAMVLLHQQLPSIALEVLSTDVDLGMYGFVFGQWRAATRAEAAVLSGSATARAQVDRARRACAGNPIAAAITTRAAVLLGTEDLSLESLADVFGRGAAPYQRDRTLSLAARRTA